MGINTQIEKTRVEIISVLQNSKLPVGVCYYLTKDVLSEVESTYQQALMQEAAMEANAPVERASANEKEEE